MKIGILTLHSQLNYGGVLQCWALQTALKRLGHEVVVIDRWLDRENHYLERGFNKKSRKWWLKAWVRQLFGTGYLRFWFRVWRTKRFISKNLLLTNYHFHSWDEAPKDLGVDLVVVGSDQVWNPAFWYGDAYLMHDAPDVPKVSYAASIGVSQLMDADRPKYLTALQRFKAISCRETEGVEICRDLGLNAVHTVDPTQLIKASDWSLLIGSSGSLMQKRPILVCYFLGTDLSSVMPHLQAFARERKCRVKVFAGDWVHQPVLAMPNTPRRMWRCLRMNAKLLFSRVKIMEGEGPKEFVKAFSSATWVVSDSFHALMFSAIFNRNCRILAPQNAGRVKMFGRITEFAKHVSGPLVANDIAGALASIRSGASVSYDTEWLESERKRSISFLEENVGRK